MNPDLQMTLDDCVDDVLGMLTGLDLSYQPTTDRYRSVVRALNKSLRQTALEKEWSYYASTEELGEVVAGQQEVGMRSTVRPRIIGDDSVRLVDDDGTTLVWAPFLPRDAIDKYIGRRGLWAAAMPQSLRFSRPFGTHEAGLRIHVPVMREPRMFVLPPHPENDVDPVPTVPAAVRNQLLDFPYPDAVLARAAFYYAQSDPIMQPRVQTLEAEYKNIFYALNERDERHTDSTYLNEFAVPIQSDVSGTSYQDTLHPHADERY